MQSRFRAKALTSSLSKHIDELIYCSAASKSMISISHLWHLVLQLNRYIYYWVTSYLWFLWSWEFLCDKLMTSLMEVNSTDGKKARLVFVYLIRFDEKDWPWIDVSVFHDPWDVFSGVWIAPSWNRYIIWIF